MNIYKAENVSDAESVIDLLMYQSYAYNRTYYNIPHEKLVKHLKIDPENAKRFKMEYEKDE